MVESLYVSRKNPLVYVFKHFKLYASRLSGALQVVAKEATSKTGNQN